VIRAVAQYGIKVPRWEVQSLINSLVLWKGKSMSAIVTIGIDLAKNVFAVHGVDATGKSALVRPSVPRSNLLELIASLAPLPHRHGSMLRRPPLGARVSRSSATPCA
jgi:transposase